MCICISVRIHTHIYIYIYIYMPSMYLFLCMHRFDEVDSQIMVRLSLCVICLFLAMVVGMHEFHYVCLESNVGFQLLHIVIHMSDEPASCPMSACGRSFMDLFQPCIRCLNVCFVDLTCDRRI